MFFLFHFLSIVLSFIISGIGMMAVEMTGASAQCDVLHCVEIGKKVAGRFPTMCETFLQTCSGCEP
jgi:hypothetical protein